MNTQTTNPFQRGSQNFLLLNEMRRGRKITSTNAASRFDVMNLTARIHEMRSKGVDVVTNYVTRPNGSRDSYYTLAV